VADDTTGLQVVSVVNPESPLVVGGVPTPGRAFDLDVAGDHAYVAANWSGLQVIDISNPSLPVIVGEGELLHEAYSVGVSGDYAYMGVNGFGLQVMDISDPTAPTFVDFELLNNGVTQPREIIAVGDLLYVADSRSRFFVVSILDPGHPEVISSVHTFSPAWDVRLSGDFAYVAAGAGIEVIDVSNESDPMLLGAIWTEDLGRGVAFNDEVVFIAASGAGIQVAPLHCEGPSSVPEARGDLPLPLLTAYPNPALGSAEVRFAMIRPGAVRLQVFDLSGRRVRDLLRGSFGAGQHGITWDGRDDGGRPVAGGVYLVHLKGEEGSRRAPLVLLH
jgi:hypothetical protein